MGFSTRCALRSDGKPTYKGKGPQKSRQVLAVEQGAIEGTRDYLVLFDTALAFSFRTDGRADFRINLEAIDIDAVAHVVIEYRFGPLASQTESRDIGIGACCVPDDVDTTGRIETQRFNIFIKCFARSRA